MTISSRLLLAALAAGWAGAAASADCERLYIGTHQQVGAPSLFTASFTGGGFGAASAVASIARPTWLVKDPARPLLYAVSETGNDGASQGRVLSLRIAGGDGALAEVSATASGGGGPTHLALDARGGALLVANYGTGQVASLAVDGDAVLAGPVSVMQNHGTGPTARQRSPHAHGVVIDPSGRYVLAPDLGADRVFIYRYDAATRQLAAAATPYLQLPPGTGPRHLVFGADGRHAYLLAELSGELLVYAWDAGSGTLQAVQTLSTLSAGYSGKISAGELLVSGDGKHLYVSNRGDNTLIAYQIAAGRLAQLQRIAAGGEQPWHLALSPDGRWLLASNEASSTVTAFRVGADGRLTASADKLHVPKPVNVVFAGACGAATAAHGVAASEIEQGGVKGSLLLPETGTPGAVVLLVADGGATDRDGNAPGASSNSLRLLAQALAGQGIASVRYDKRGVGASLAWGGQAEHERGAAPAQADIAQQAADAAAWIARLKQDGRFSKVLVIGHGEGALVGLLAANQVGAGGFVSLAGSGARTAQEFGKLKMHARIILGDADPVAGPDAARQLEQARPGTPMAVIAGMNHALQSGPAGDPQLAPELVTALTAFINKR